MRFLFTLLFIGFSFFGFSQKSKTDNKPQTQPPVTETKPASQQPSSSVILTQHYLRKYATASRWSDYEVAKDALYDLIIENPGNDSLIFTLAYYYFENQKYAPSLLVTQDLLQRDPKNTAYLELAGAASESLGVYDRALQNYESLFLLTNNVGTLYKISFLQLDLKRFTEAQTNADILLSKAEVDTLKVFFNDAEGNPKEYPMKVSILNLKGLVSQETGDKDAAKRHFEAALAISSDFIPAKQNLAKLK